MLKGNEIRKLYLDFFKNKHQHTVVESSSLVPDNPTVLLTTAGMLQFLPIFLEIQPCPYEPARATSCQKCARAGGKDSDIENVGRTPRHHTFFEMLGNFSFGDYYKKEIIPWAWEFVTEVLKLDKDRLWITIFETDDEAFEIWRSVGVPAERIKRKGKKDNFWGPPGASGSCGPCSEIHYDLGEQYSCGHPNCGIDTCECDRWVEIWNLVFTELYQDEEGNQSPLGKKNVDTGMGLERITMVCQGVASTFETDLLRPILDKVSAMCGVPYKQSEKTDVSLRIITDHARCVTFLISDGVIPGNEGRSYVLRMILRRALRHGKILGMELPFLYKLVDTVVENYGEAYPELVKNKQKVIDTIKAEEERFNKTLDRGYKLLEEFIESKKDIDGESAFKLYDTFGFPLELTKEIAQENGLKVDEDGYKVAMQEQKDRAKAATAKISVTGDIKYAQVEKEVGSTNFIGYNENECNDAKILAQIEGEGYVRVAWVEGHSPEAVRLLDKGRAYLKQLEEGAGVIDVAPIDTQQPSSEQVSTGYSSQMTQPDEDEDEDEVAPEVREYDTTYDYIFDPKVKPEAVKKALDNITTFDKCQHPFWFVFMKVLVHLQWIPASTYTKDVLSWASLQYDLNWKTKKHLSFSDIGGDKRDMNREANEWKQKKIKDTDITLWNTISKTEFRDIEKYRKFALLLKKTFVHFIVDGLEVKVVTDFNLGKPRDRVKFMKSPKNLINSGK